MKAHFELKNILQSIDGEPCDSYKSIEGEYLFNSYTLLIDNVVENAPSRIRVRISQDVAGFPDDTYKNRSREIALRDFITRKFQEGISKYISDGGKSSQIMIDSPGQEILERTSAFIDKSFVEIRFTIELSKNEEKITAKEVEILLFEELPQIVESSAIFENLDKDSLYTHIETSEDADFLRNELENLRLIAFVAEGSILPRESETSPLPLKDATVVPFLSPYILRMDIELPNRGQISGLGIPRGITVITGEGSQGKSTLLNAIEQGIYNHIPGDGREYVVSNPNSVRIRSEKERNITNVNISAFIEDASQEENFRAFSTENATSDTSQAANIVEAVEVGADVLLIDENTSANDFLTRNHQKKDSENRYSSKYIEKVAGLFNEYMVSTILAIEDSEEYFDVANFVIRVTNFKAEDIKVDPNAVLPNNNMEIDGYVGSIGERIPLAESIDLSTADLSSFEHFVTKSQANAIGDAIEYAKKYMDGKKSFRQLTSLVMLDIGRGGLDVLNPSLHRDYAEFRKIELAAVINRLNALKVEQKN